MVYYHQLFQRMKGKLPYADTRRKINGARTKTAAHIQEIDENTTIMLGVMRHQGQDIKRVFQRLETMDESLNTLGLQLNQLDIRLNQLDTRLSRFETKFDDHTALLTQILERLS